MGRVLDEQTARANIGDLHGENTNLNEATAAQKAALEATLSTPTHTARVVTLMGEYLIVKWYAGDKVFTTYKTKDYVGAPQAAAFLAEMVRITSGIPSAEVTIAPESIEIAEGATDSFTASVAPATLDQSITWTSADEAIATVDATGTVTGVARGATTVRSTSVANPAAFDTGAVTVLGTGTDILTFSLAAQTGAATINAVAHTVAIEVANGTNVTALPATYTVSPGAGLWNAVTFVQSSGVTQNDYTNPVTMQVQAEDAVTTQDWVVTVTVAVG